MLFSASIVVNIRFGNPDMPREQVMAAARRVHAEPFILRIEGGFDRLCSERGSPPPPDSVSSWR